jgi:non-canonical (house-cleaning) NTP pyrophosphatase
MGATGFLTRGIISRELSFRIAVAFALAPFLHVELYKLEGARADR